MGSQQKLSKLEIDMRFVLLCLALCFTYPLKAGDQEVMKPIYSLFDGMREGNGDKVRAAFSPDAIFYRAHAELRSGNTAEGFAKAVEQPRDKVWNEQIWDVDIKVDDKLASVWTKFAFYLGDDLRHCGVNSFQLYHFEDGWKIIYLVDTYRDTGCEGKPD
jgi:hypothetical protein